MKVHSALGSGFQELIYQRALEIEFAFNKIYALSEREFPIYYRDAKLVQEGWISLLRTWSW